MAATEREAGERPKSAPEIKIPEAIKADLKEGLERVVEAIKREKPDLIIFLQRSGSLFKPAVEAMIGTKRPIIEANIGREISTEYTNQRIVEDPSFLVGDGENPVELDKLVASHQEDYEDWLKTGGNERIKPCLEEIVAEIKKNAGEAEVKKVLIVDDFRSEGNTLVTAPIIVKMALGEEVTVSSAVILRDPQWAAYWVSSILKETFGLLSSAEGHFLADLMKGYLDVSELKKSAYLSAAIKDQKIEGGLIKIESSEQLQLLGTYIAESYQVEDPLEKLKEKFGEKFLLEFSGKVVEAFENASLKK